MNWLSSVLHISDLPKDAEEGDCCFVIEPMPSIPSMPGESYVYTNGAWSQFVWAIYKCPSCQQEVYA